MSEDRSIAYSEKLKDPRWQKKRLEILERDQWRCQFCAQDRQTLHVHHLFYFSGKDPWDINNGFLLTLCEECHDSKTDGDVLSVPDILHGHIGDLLDELWQKGITGEVGIIPFIQALQKCVIPRCGLWDFKIIPIPDILPGQWSHPEIWQGYGI